MMELQGKHNGAKIFSDSVDATSIKQVFDLLDKEEFKDSQIRIMPDVHAGAGCVIGLSMTIKDKVIPNLVGVDIGCGVMAIELGKIDIDYSKLDQVIRTYIPSGFDIRKTKHLFNHPIDYNKVIAPFNLERAMLSMGTLGGGNHFIEVAEDDECNKYLLIHSGSRHFGNQIAQYYQNIAIENVKSKLRLSDDEEKESIVRKLKERNQEYAIQETLKAYGNSRTLQQVDKDLAHLDGQDMKDYINDMDIAQKYAYWNRMAMIVEIFDRMNWDLQDKRVFDTVHNYIDMKHMILRKGAVSAQKGERLVIPINMRDGSIIAIGKGNEDWNYTSPHGAGRLYSRSKAKEQFNLDEFKETMKDIYTTSVSQSTLDECPMAYKPIDEILTHVGETVEIEKIIKPRYNFKA